MNKDKKDLKPIPVSTDILPTNNKEAITKFLDQPLPTIAAAITGALSGGTEGAFLIVGHLAQGALKGKFLKQFGIEITKLIEKGEIPEDYANKKFGFETLTELLKFIDEEEVDEDRFLAIKAMFFAVNRVNESDGEKILNYQLFKLSKKLSSSELLLLNISFKVHKTTVLKSKKYEDWVGIMADLSGHKMKALVRLDEGKLISYGFIEPLGFIKINSARLTDLGIKFCENILRFNEVTLEE